MLCIYFVWAGASEIFVLICASKYIRLETPCYVCVMIGEKVI